MSRQFGVTSLCLARLHHVLERAALVNDNCLNYSTRHQYHATAGKSPSPPCSGFLLAKPLSLLLLLLKPLLLGFVCGVSFFMTQSFLVELRSPFPSSLPSSRDSLLLFFLFFVSCSRCAGRLLQQVCRPQWKAPNGSAGLRG